METFTLSKNYDPKIVYTLTGADGTVDEFDSLKELRTFLKEETLVGRAAEMEYVTELDCPYSEDGFMDYFLGVWEDVASREGFIIGSKIV